MFYPEMRQHIKYQKPKAYISYMQRVVEKGSLNVMFDLLENAH